MVTQVTSTVMGSNAISANNIADNAIVSRHIGDNVILARHVENSVDPGIVQANLNSTTANVNSVAANVNTVAANVNTVQDNVAGILDGATFSGSILLGESSSLGVSNVNPEVSSVTIGSPANVIIQYGTSANPVGGNVIIGEGNDDISGSATAFRLDVRGTANTGAITATTIALSADGGVQVPNDGNIGSAGATDAMQISSGGIVTFKDDIKLKNDGTIGSAGSAGAITIASDGIVTFVDDIKIKDSGTIGSATTPGAITVAGDGAITIADDLTITGNLTVSGDTVSQDVTDLTVEDRIILAAKNASGSPSLDTGLMVSRGAQGNVFIGYDESVNKVVLAHTSSPHTNTSISATSAANLDARHITAESLVLSVDAGVLVPNDGNIGSAGSTAAIQIASDGVVTFADDIKIKDGGTIGSATTAGAITIASDGIVTFVDDIKVKNDGTIGSAGSAGAITIASDGIVTFVDDIKIKDGGTIGSATTAGAVTIASDGDIALAGGLGIAGNTAPVASALSLGTPANVVLRTHAASGKANIIVGDATATSPYNLDVRGTANVGVFTTQGVDPLANDLATYNRLNANLNVVQDNVTAIAGTTLSPATNVVTSVAGANAYGIGAAVSAIARTRVSLSGINQLPTTDYVVPSSGVIQLTDPDTSIPAGIPIHINYWN